MQVPSCSICRRFILSRLASASRAAFHAKTQTLGGAPHFHSRFHAGLVPSGLALVSPIPSRAMIASRAILYAERTKNRPVLSGCHATESASSWRDGLIFIISMTSTGKKCCLISVVFQDPSAFRGPATHFNLHRRFGVIGSKDGPLGIQGSRHMRISAPFPTCQMYPCFTSSSPYSIASHVEDPFPVNTVSVIEPNG